ncbi:hypothetical protein LGK97_19390 [Clostridium sp. CS001]|uniref:hypothetical protein n=1 Tax=Clostridium sp. CS001 TaxID=2880648 RepID=UPI001CF565B4|nr:hypothetical protein [Clostridium sp. CS001]MCB2291869.1 hypothetical protein [Clostridium sp. CS001]
MDEELIKSLSALLDEKLTPIKNDLKSIKSQQEESISILRPLEHKADINKAEHDKLFNDIANLSGSVENMRKDLSAVEVVTARNMENIAQLKLVK